MNSSCTIRPAVASDKQAWDAYVHHHPQATFFHLSNWPLAVEEVFGHGNHSLLAWHNQQLVGILPLVRQRTLLFGDALISTPFAVYGGAIADSPQITWELEEQATLLARHLGVDYLQARRFDAPRPDWHHHDLYYTFQRPLAATPEGNLLAIPRKQRAAVRAGIKEGLTLVEEEEVAPCHHLFSISQRNLGTPALPLAFFKSLRELFGPQVVIHGVWHSGKRIASVMSFLFANHVLPYYAGSNHESRSLYAHPFMYWALMNWAAERGCAIFDFGRSKKNSGSFDFKVNFGFTPQPLGYSSLPIARPDLPQHNPANPRYRLLIRWWRKLPLAVANPLGALLSRGLG